MCIMITLLTWPFVFIIGILLISKYDIVKAECPCQAAKRMSDEQRYKAHANTLNNVKEYVKYVKNDDENWVPSEDMAFIPGGEITVGTNMPFFKADSESPEQVVTIKPFYIDKYEVSNKNFKEFVDATNYVTEAETFGDSFVFKDQLSDDVKLENDDFRVVSAEWWYKIKGANWKTPYGPGSSIEGRDDYPVIHVSWHDAIAYCKWQKKRLPSEHEWETACRGGKKGKLFPWGNKLNPQDKHW